MPVHVSELEVVPESVPAPHAANRAVSRERGRSALTRVAEAIRDAERRRERGDRVRAH